MTDLAALRELTARLAYTLDTRNGATKTGPTAGSPREHDFRPAGLTTAASAAGTDMIGVAMKALTDPDYAYLRPAAAVKAMGVSKTDGDVSVQVRAARMANSNASPQDPAEYTTGMVALIPAAEDAQRVAVRGGEPVDQIHVTLLFLGEVADWPVDGMTRVADLLRPVAAATPPITGRVAGPAVFNPAGDEPAHVLIVNGDGLTGLHGAVVAALDPVQQWVPDQYDPWVSHVTRAYGQTAPPLARDVATEPMRFERLRVAFGPDHIDLLLTGGRLDPAGYDSYGAYAGKVGHVEAQRVILDTDAGLDVRLSMFRAAEHARKDRRVATPAGERRYHEPIGSRIADPDTDQDTHLTSTSGASDGAGWSEIRGPDGRTYQVGHDGETWVAVVEDGSTPIVTGESRAAVIDRISRFTDRDLHERRTRLSEVMRRWPAFQAEDDGGYTFESTRHGVISIAPNDTGGYRVTVPGPDGTTSRALDFPSLATAQREILAILRATPSEPRQFR